MRCARAWAWRGACVAGVRLRRPARPVMEPWGVRMGRTLPRKRHLFSRLPSPPATAGPAGTRSWSVTPECPTWLTSACRFGV